METHLWVNSQSGLMDTDHFSNILKRQFTEGGVAPLGVLHWRHVSVAICDAHLKQIKEVDDAEGDNIHNLQRGHSSQTANLTYGGTSGYEVDRQSDWYYRMASHAMHRFWNVGEHLHWIIHGQRLTHSFSD